ncbi:MAG: ATP-dependent DNA helicase RecG [Alphaproteobacteria bacterium]|nr:MAG: ATP-dependent DNA helicase RecG [Alphaproteobacteria bacterium]TAF14399.1 MAG: ATP-dependent DNA helicase RecG [Alphaproteobacteria bacterium]TAF40111.1 MAG: ATP-dependent DNA helicase RecG [Alphaproteobacteria bacterium]TAF77543.1 MAG: ATP-dependent DNA helicase RecG [Alphaproteobacteria bacterium]
MSDMLSYLSRRIDTQKGIGEKHARTLSTFFARKKRTLSPDIRATLGDLLFHAPADYHDRRTITPLSHAHEGLSTIRVRILEHRTPQQNPSPKHPLRIYCEDYHSHERLILIFFRIYGDMRTHYPIGQERIISGVLQRFDGTWTMTHPERTATIENAASLCVLDPIYSTPEGISSTMFARFITNILRNLPPSPEWISPATLEHHGWASFHESITTIHRPQDNHTLRKAKERLAFDEGYALQLGMLQLRAQQQHYDGICFAFMEHPVLRDAITRLPFALTEGQKEVLHTLDCDLSSGKRMLRLLQGDVGSGKTVIAALLMLATALAGHQAVLMAPTELLARQHYSSIENLLGILPFPLIFLSGSMTNKQKEEARERIRTHPASLIIGTHALFQESVDYANLATVIIDEQHRFGVAQRLALSEKCMTDGATTRPHMLLMTATPIPRSLAMTHYGDLECSMLTEKPANRLPIDTRVMNTDKREALFAAIGRALQKGEKIYWICPLVESSVSDDDTDKPLSPQALMMASLQDVLDRQASLEALFPNQTAVIHGQMPIKEREAIMQKFLVGEVRVLVATVVVEVGVNVPDATIIIIENAERFGLAQLHQLRGRVGRSDKPSCCILLYHEPCSAIAKQRLHMMRETNDGFILAETDLRLRGSGEVLGTKQTGVAEGCFFNLDEHEEFLVLARNEAMQFLNQLPPTHHADHHKTWHASAPYILMKLFGRDEASRFLGSG